MKHHPLYLAAKRASRADSMLRSLVKLDAHPDVLKMAARQLIESWIHLGNLRALHGR